MQVLLVSDLHPLRLGDSYKRAIARLGHHVTCFDVRAEHKHLSHWLRSRIGHRLTIRSKWAREIGAQRYNAQLLAAARDARPNLIFLVGADFVLAETVRLMRRLAAVVLYNPDNPLPPHYTNRPETLEVARECDLYLVWGEALVALLKQHGVRNAAFLPFGWDPEAFPYQGYVEKEFDVAFIGGWDPARETFLEQVAQHCELKIWGPPYWLTRTQRQSRLRSCLQGGELDPPSAAATLAKARIALNVVRAQHIVNGQPDGVIMRNFEVPGAGGFLLTTRTSTAVRLFPEWECGAYFQDTASCISRIEHYLEHRAERDAITARAHKEVCERHLYTHRFVELLALLD